MFCSPAIPIRIESGTRFLINIQISNQYLRKKKNHIIKNNQYILISVFVLIAILFIKDHFKELRFL